MLFTIGVRLIFTKLQVVHKHLVFEPANPRNKALLKSTDILFCHKEFGEHINVSGGNNSFKIKNNGREITTMEVMMRN